MNLVENSVWNMDINGKPAINALGELEQKLADVKKPQADLTRGTKEWIESKAEMKGLEAEIKKVREEMGTACMTVKQLEGYHRQLNKEIKDQTRGTDGYIEKSKDLQEVNTRLASVWKVVRAVADEANPPKAWQYERLDRQRVHHGRSGVTWPDNSIYLFTNGKK